MQHVCNQHSEPIQKSRAPEAVALEENGASTDRNQHWYAVTIDALSEAKSMRTVSEQQSMIGITEKQGQGRESTPCRSSHSITVMQMAASLLTNGEIRSKHAIRT